MGSDDLDIVGGGSSYEFSTLTIVLVALAVCIIGGVLYKIYVGNTSKCEGDDLCSTEIKELPNENHCDGDKCYL
jgi:hypothetical protein